LKSALNAKNPRWPWHHIWLSRGEGPYTFKASSLGVDCRDQCTFVQCKIPRKSRKSRKKFSTLWKTSGRPSSYGCPVGPGADRAAFWSRDDLVPRLPILTPEYSRHPGARPPSRPPLALNSSFLILNC
jgi:hypothetical protein